MSEEIQPFISNSEQLISKMFGYSEIYVSSLSEISSIIDKLQPVKITDKASKSFVKTKSIEE